MDHVAALLLDSRSMFKQVFSSYNALMIDVHTHLHPEKLFRAIRKWFSENSTWKLSHPTEPLLVAGKLKAYGVKKFVYCSYAHKVGIAEGINDWLVRTSFELERFGLPLATVHLEDLNHVRYYAKALEGGCIGLKIHEDVQKLLIDDKRFDPIHELTAAHNGFVLVHVGPIPWSTDTRDGPDRIRRVLERHPHIRIVVAHMGSPDTRQYLSLMNDYPNLYMDTTMALAPQSPLLMEVHAQLFGQHADRLLYGSDFPNIPYEYEDDVNAVSGLMPDAQTKRLVFEGNAERLIARCAASKAAR